jgi:uncharacterized membrane protein
MAEMDDLRPKGLNLSVPWIRSTMIIIAVLVLGAWLVLTPSGLLGKADAVGYAVCHRIDLRSFHLGERQLPLCVRCSGTYMGVLLSLGFYFLVRPKASGFPSWKLAIPLFLFVGIFGIDGLNSYLHLFPNAPHVYPPSNDNRLITGMFFGIALASLAYPGFSQSVWKQPAKEPALRSARDLLTLVVPGIGLILLIQTENPLILYPLAILSSMGVIVLLSMVYAMVVLMVTRRENKITAWREMVLPLLGGLVLTIIQIGLIDFGRHLLTGTWSGFTF